MYAMNKASTAENVKKGPNSQPVRNVTALVQGPIREPSPNQPAVNEVRPKIMISLTRNSGENWSSTQKQPNTTNTLVSAPPPNLTTSPINPVSSSVAENVSHFLNGIRATFRQDNVIVAASVRQKKVALEKKN